MQMIIISQNPSQLVDSIISVRMNSNSKSYPTEFQTYDEGWEELFQSLDHLRSKLGQERYAQLVEMTTQAKTHYDNEAEDPHQGFLGSWLMQDIEQVVKGKPPFAYPEEEYRWPRPVAVG